MPQTSVRRPWTRAELIAAFNLYCQLTFGKLHKSNPQIVLLARLLERSPSSVSMKLVNFASLDPGITATESQAVLERLAHDHGEVLPRDEHDKAFDRGLLTLNDDFTVTLSDALTHKADVFTRSVFLPLQGKRISVPERFVPDARFLAHHRQNIFIGA